MTNQQEPIQNNKKNDVFDVEIKKTEMIIIKETT